MSGLGAFAFGCLFVFFSASLLMNELGIIKTGGMFVTLFVIGLVVVVIISFRDQAASRGRPHEDANQHE